MSVDELDRRILRALQHEARRPYAEIAAELEVAEVEVERRVQRMVDHGLLTFTAVTDPLALGFAREAMLGITLEPDLGDEERQAATGAVAALPEVHYLVRTTGGFDLLCEVTGISDAHLLEVVSHRVKPIPGVARLHTFLYLSTEKLVFDWDVP